LNIYDRVLKETFLELFVPLSRLALKLDVTLIETVPCKLEKTIEREPDFVFKVKDNQGRVFLLHIELQTENDRKMLERMALYHILLWSIYKLPVMQYVLYIGKKKLGMKNKLKHFGVDYRYNLLDIRSIDCEIFLKEQTSEGVVLSVLCDRKEMKRAELVTDISHPITHIAI
jgi:hypothetical protein